MKPNWLHVILTLAIVFLCLPADAKTVIGFGLFENRSKSAEFDYLEQILPNSFAVSVESSFEISTLKPADLSRDLESHNLTLKGNYRDDEIYAVAKALSVDYFVYGSFRSLPENNIEITVNIYNCDTEELFSFVNTGRMETEIFTLVDRLTVIFDELFKKDFLFKTSEITSRSKLAFITNLDPVESNEFYTAFQRAGFTISSVQGNDLSSPLRADHFEKLRYITLKDRSFQRVRGAEPLVFHRSQWNGKTYLTAQENLQNTITRFFYNYPKQQELQLKKLSQSYKFNIDYLFLIGFDKKRHSAWIRGFDLKRFDSSLIWIQTGIEPNTSSDGVAGIAMTMMSLFKEKGLK